MLISELCYLGRHFCSVDMAIPSKPKAPFSLLNSPVILTRPPEVAMAGTSTLSNPQFSNVSTVPSLAVLVTLRKNAKLSLVSAAN